MIKRILLPLLLMVQGPGPAPVVDLMYHCVTPTGEIFDLHYVKAPDSIQTTTSQSVVTSDVTVPVITSVLNSGSVPQNLLSNTVRISPTLNGVPITVIASDDIGVDSAQLYVDGVFKTATAVDGLQVFYLRWNAKTISLGTHTFKLIIWDKGGNLAEESWTMER